MDAAKVPVRGFATVLRYMQLAFAVCSLFEQIQGGELPPTEIRGVTIGKYTWDIKISGAKRAKK